MPANTPTPAEPGENKKGAQSLRERRSKARPPLHPRPRQAPPNEAEATASNSPQAGVLPNGPTPSSPAAPEPNNTTSTPPVQEPTPPATPIPIPNNVGNGIDRIIKSAIEYAQQHINEVDGQSMLDASILEMRKRGLSISEIARHFHGTIAQSEIEHRIARQLAHFNALSTSEYRALQIARLEDAINMCYDYARGGSEEHVKMLLLAIERLNKMFELESTKTSVEVTLVTSHQASLILGIADAIITVITTHPALRQAIEFNNANNPDPTNVIEGSVIEAITAEALESATEQLIAAQHATIEMDLNKETSRVVQAIQ